MIVEKHFYAVAQKLRSFVLFLCGNHIVDHPTIEHLSLLLFICHVRRLFIRKLSYFFYGLGHDDVDFVFERNSKTTAPMTQLLIWKITIAITRRELVPHKLLKENNAHR